MQSPVLIIGGSLVGLSAALSLRVLGVPCIVLERHAHISNHPRAIGFTPRTMDIYHKLGIAYQIPQAPENFSLRRARVDSLAGKWHETTSWTETTTSNKTQQDQKKDKKQYSPFRGAVIPQDKLEAILEAAAKQHGADIRRQHTLLHVDQDAHGVTATVTDSTGKTSQITGSYLIACDGNRSTIREQLRIPRHGRGHMQTLRSVLFRAPSLEKYLETGIHQFSIDQPNLKAFLTTYNDGRWVLMFPDDHDRNEQALLSAIHQAIGEHPQHQESDIEIITTGTWAQTALIADSFQCNRIFLAGDAAHTLPPNRGGYGANTGIADADNLAWKLAAVLAGDSGPKLLQTYDAERRPVALLRHDQIFARADYRMHANSGMTADNKGGAEVLDDDAVEFGELYVSEGIIRDQHGGSLPPAMKPDEWAGEPGTRIPHLWLKKDGEDVSLLDVVGGGAWTLLSEEQSWSRAVESLHEQALCRVPVRFGHVGIRLQVDTAGFQAAMGLSRAGASLIRPDGYIAWRSTGMPRGRGLNEVLGEVLDRVAFRTSK